MHEPYGPRNGDIYTANLRTVRATDTFILKGTGDWETFQPHFTYHGFVLGNTVLPCVLCVVLTTAWGRP